MTRGTINTVLLFAILLVSAVFQSEMGGPDSIYNAVDVALIGVFVLANLRFEPLMLMVFAVPTAFLALSVVLNIDTLAIGGIKSAGAIAAGYALFTLRPVPLNRRLLRNFIILYLVVQIALSLYITMDRQLVDFGKQAANANFNVNPNGAALFFVGGILLSLAVVEGWLGWLFVVPLILLTISTGSRGGSIGVAAILLLYAAFSRQEDLKSPPRGWFERLGSTWRVWVVVGSTAIVAQRMLPDAVDFLAGRFAVGASRADPWSTSLDGINTLGSFAFGTGPASLTARTGAAPHSSYIEAIGNNGVFFLITTLFAVFVWLRRAVLDGARDLLWIVPPVLLYGTVETILFNGIHSIWLLTMLLGVVVLSRAAGPDRSAAAAADSPAVALGSLPRRRLVNRGPGSDLASHKWKRP